MKVLGIIANCSKPRAADVLRRIAGKAGELGIELLADPSTAALLQGSTPLPAAELVRRADAIMALGGDGTVLRVVRDLDAPDKPLIGVNIGSLGFLTSVSEHDLEKGLECLAADDFVLSEWATLECEVLRGGRGQGRYRALNDAVVRNAASARVITLEVRVNDEYVTSYVCDGLIVATPAGSTGHSLSAGGPILSPRAPALVISLICPHTLTSRPLVVPDDAVIQVCTVDSREPSMLAVDGQVGQPLDPGDCVQVRRGDRSVRFIRLPGYSYFGVLRQKLRWSGSSV